MIEKLTEQEKIEAIELGRQFKFDNYKILECHIQKEKKINKDGRKSVGYAVLIDPNYTEDQLIIKFKKLKQAKAFMISRLGASRSLVKYSADLWYIDLGIR